LPIGERIKNQEGINVLASGSKKIFTFLLFLIRGFTKERRGKDKRKKSGLRGFLRERDSNKRIQ